ncbi:MAG: hypothetical protein ABS95_00970 [Verrucomicrobia bacterium SCN 57-15]|nr:MAG: hypothetical protein ABS95_00970 [Verrucomicrobia bacterium SCN 57-15]
MKPNQKPESDEQLSKLLREWQPATSLPPRFQEAVWRRIEQTEATAKLSFWHVVTHWVDNTFRRPALAVSYVAVLLVLGLSAGYLQARDTSSRTLAQMRTAYVQSIDPYQAPRN